MTAQRQLTELEQHLLNDFQHDFPMSPTPYADMAQQLGVSEQQVLATLENLRNEGLISRVGAVFRPNSVGASTLAAMSVPEDQLESVAEIISSYPQIGRAHV